VNKLTSSAGALGYDGTTEGELHPLSGMDIIMRYRFSMVATAALVLGASGAMAAELPTYEVMGFPITQHQLVAVNSAYVQERSPTPTLTLGGMPASPVQIAVLTPRPQKQMAAKDGQAGSGLTGASEIVATAKER
jgi:hypothetical protein